MQLVKLKRALASSGILLVGFNGPQALNLGGQMLAIAWVWKLSKWLTKCVNSPQIIFQGSPKCPGPLQNGKTSGFCVPINFAALVYTFVTLFVHTSLVKFCNTNDKVAIEILVECLCCLMSSPVRLRLSPLMTPFGTLPQTCFSFKGNVFLSVLWFAQNENNAHWREAIP